MEDHWRIDIWPIAQVSIAASSTDCYGILIDRSHKGTTHDFMDDLNETTPINQIFVVVTHQRNPAEDIWTLAFNVNAKSGSTKSFEIPCNADQVVEKSLSIFHVTERVLAI